jgi:hypothetical protein
MDLEQRNKAIILRAAHDLIRAIEGPERVLELAARLVSF